MEDNCNLEELLSQELTDAREEARNNENLIIQIISLAEVFIGIIYGIFFDTGKQINENIKCVLFVLNITVVSAACSYLIILGVRNVLIYYHIKDIEAQLKKYEIDENKPVIVRWFTLISPIITRNPSHLKTLYAFSYYIGYTVAVCSAFLFSVIIIISQYTALPSTSRDKLHIPICIFSIFMLLIILSFALCTFRTNDMYKQLRSIAISGKRTKQNTNGKSHKIRRIILYYLYPKKEDWQKLVLFIIGAIVGILFNSGKIDKTILTSISWKDFIIYLCIVDGCLYQSRYHLNDIRGINTDAVEHKEKRLPYDILGIRKSVIVAGIAIVLKVLCAFILAYKFISKEQFYIMCIYIGLLLLMTIGYEYFKEKKSTYGVLYSVCIGYPSRILVGVWWMCPKLFSIFQINTVYNGKNIIILLIAYLFYGAYVVYIPWLMNAIKLKEKMNYLDKPHYKYLYDQIKSRLTPENRGTPLRSKGKLLDSWNWTYVSSILALGIGIIWTKGINIKLLMLLEVILLVASIVLVCSSTKGILYMSVVSFIDIIVSLFIVIRIKGNVLFPTILILHQLFFLITYFSLRYLWDENFDMKEYIKQIGIMLLVIVVGKDTFRSMQKEYLHKDNNKMLSED